MTLIALFALYYFIGLVAASHGVRVSLDIKKGETLDPFETMAIGVFVIFGALVWVPMVVLLLASRLVVGVMVR